MIDVFSSLAQPARHLGDAPPAPTPTNWTGIPEPPGWKELTGGMSWPPTGAFPPSPPPACALAPGLWPCSPWPPPPPVGWPAGWPWPLPLGPAPGAPPPPPPPAAVTPPQTTAAPEKPFPWGWVVLGGLALGAGLLVMSGAGTLALNPVSESNVEHYRLAATAARKGEEALAKAKRAIGLKRARLLHEAEQAFRESIEHNHAAGAKWMTYEGSAAREEIERLRKKA